MRAKWAGVAVAAGVVFGCLGVSGAEAYSFSASGAYQADDNFGEASVSFDGSFGSGSTYNSVENYLGQDTYTEFFGGSSTSAGFSLSPDQIYQSVYVNFKGGTEIYFDGTNTYTFNGVSYGISFSQQIYDPQDVFSTINAGDINESGFYYPNLGSYVETNIAINPIPLPASAHLLGVGLIALGAAGYVVRRRAAA